MHWIYLVDTLPDVTIDTGLKFYAAPSQLPQKPWGQGHSFLKSISLDMFNRTSWYFADVRYWSKLFALHHLYPLCDLEVKVTDIEILL